MRPIRVHAPAGTIVNPVLPAACGARGVIGYRVYDAIMGALATSRPRSRDRRRRGRADADRLRRLRRGAAGRSCTTEVLVGSWGARATRGRARGRVESAREPRPTSRSSCSRPTCRSRLDRYGLVPDSGGAGRHRGGLAYVREFTVLARAGDADDPLRPARPSPVRPRRRRAGRPLEQRARLERRGARAADDADGSEPARAAATASRHVSAGGGGFGDALRARPRSRARGRPRREGVGRRRTRALRRRRSPTGASTHGRDAGC